MNQRTFNRNLSVKLNPVALRARYRIIDFLKEENKNSDLYINKKHLQKKESSYKFFNDNYKLINKLEKKKSFQELLNEEISCSEKVHDIIYKIENKFNNNNSRNNSLVQLPKINKLNSSINSNKNEKKVNEDNKTDNNHIKKTIFNNIFKNKKKKVINKRKHSMDDLKKNKSVKIKGLYGKDINTNFKITQNGGIIYTNSIWRTKNINNLVKYRRGIFFRPQEKKDYH